MSQWMECVSCGDLYPSDRKCRTRCLRPNDPRCAECHAEVVHGAIPNVTGDGVLGGNVSGGNRSGEPSPWLENNVRLMEDGAER